jgi:hypothetical protein
MAGLLGDVLPYIYSRGNALRRGLLDTIQNPVASMEQTAGLLQDKNREQQNLLAQAFSEPRDPFKVTDQRALNQASGNMLMGPLGFAPAGITAWHGSPHVFDKFDSKKIGSTTDEGHLGSAFYLSTDSSVAGRYPNAYKVEADLKNPLKLSMPNFRTNKRDLVVDALGLPKNASASDITKAAKARGFDSVILDYSPTGYAQQEIAALNGGEHMLSILERNGQPVR